MSESSSMLITSGIFVLDADPLVKRYVVFSGLGDGRSDNSRMPLDMAFFVADGGGFGSFAWLTEAVDLCCPSTICHIDMSIAELGDLGVPRPLRPWSGSLAGLLGGSPMVRGGVV